MRPTSRCILALLLAACVPAPAAVIEAPLGEGADGFPSWSERVVQVWVNRARADPAAELADCATCAEAACYSPAPPMVWSHELGRAARFHSAMLTAWGRGLTHSSPCVLPADVSARYTPGPCGGEVACGCEGGMTICDSAAMCTRSTCPTCTTFDQRVALFGAGPMAENIAQSGSPLSAMRAWLTEPYDVATCGYGTDSRGRPNGHRYNILEASRTAIGVGHAGSMFTQDFGSAATPEGVIAGVHYPETGPAIEMRANWWHTAGPTRANVNVDGTCTAMTLERGTETNGTYLASVTVGGTCARYVFELEGPTGVVTMPTTGSYGIGCPEGDWSEARPPRCGCAPTCGGRACGDDGCGGTCGTCGAGSTCTGAGTCTAPGTDAGPPVDGGPVLADDGAIARDAGAIARTDAGAGRGLDGSCACRGGTGRSRAPWALLLSLALVGWRRRR